VRELLELLEAAYLRWVGHGARVLLAVSGGGDSLALLVGSAALRQPLDLKLEIATLDHGLRAGSDAEGRAVEKLSAELGLSWHTRALSLAAGPGVEARARRARYQALEEIRRAQGLDWIATAHTASDQAETVLMRLARGSALSGAAGILERRGRVIRPLLRCTRSQK